MNHNTIRMDLAKQLATVTKHKEILVEALEGIPGLDRDDCWETANDALAKIKETP